MAAARTRIVIADDHPIFREGIRRVLEKHPDLAIVGEADDGKAALRLIAEHEPEVALLDISMPGLSGLEAARELGKSKSTTKVVLLTMFKEEDMLMEAMDAGVRGYVLKENAVLDIVSCLRKVAAGEYFISPAISHLLVKRNTRARELAQERPGLASLTPMERRVLALIADGKTSKEIGKELFISPKTVDNHRFNTAAKLGLHGPNALLKFAMEKRSSLSP
ncbi:MAG TPA: response regulator transcription factor [Methylomirabilota bacterium]|nr:response regulator transcription factor [Methylomirabilota bacterium]